MALDYQDTFGRLVAKANLLAERYSLLLNQKLEIEAKAAELQQTVTQQNAELEKLRLEVEYLRTASVLSPHREQIEATRSMITDIVREIDRCITDLSD